MNFTFDQRSCDSSRRHPVSLLILLTSALALSAADASAQTSSRHLVQPRVAKPGLPSSRVETSRLDRILQQRLKNVRRQSVQDTVDVIATLNPGQDLPSNLKRYARRYFRVINAYELDRLPVSQLSVVQNEVSIHRAHFNHVAQSLDLLSNEAVEASALVQQLGYTGAGVGVAFIDSGFTNTIQPDLGDDRVKFFDFVAPNNKLRVDLNGHGTHVAGIVGGTGTLDSRERGVAPDTSIVSLRVLDEDGKGSIANIIAALDWVAANYQQYNIRIVNLSVGTGVYESYWTDPLTLAAKALVDKGIVVVAAAGNFGKSADGELQWGGITSPGVAPWVLTTCAFSTMGTMDPSDDAVANFSSSGPTAIDFTAKPDICAPGVGIVSLAAPESQLYAQGALQTPSWLIDPGNHPGYAFSPYLSLTGTSQAAPFVTGTVALMLQANPKLTPNLVKAILQYTAKPQPDVSPLRQGAGFLNTSGAVSLATFYAHAAPGTTLPIDSDWSAEVIWGNHLLTGGAIDPHGSAWMPGVEWGWARTQGDHGAHITWGTVCHNGCDNLVWPHSDDDNIVWGTSDDDNIVWGTSDDDNIVWGTSDDDNIVWGTSDDDNIVWGTSDDDNIVWGTSDDDNIVWGTDCGGRDCDGVVWGASDDDNIVWGTAQKHDNVVWLTSDDDNIVWGTSDDDNIVWGTSDDDNIVWGTAARENVVWPVYQQGGR